MPNFLLFTKNLEMNLTKKKFRNIRKDQAIFIEWEYWHKTIIAKDIMIKATYLHLDDEIETILKKLKSEAINYCVVLDDDWKFIGEITDEILLKIIAHTSMQEPLVKMLDIWYKRWVNYTKAKDYVKKHSNTVKENTPLYEIMKLIDKKWFQFVPVIDEDEKVVGMISPSSIINFILNR